jgi:uncharacterized protein (TIGR03905 family)
MTYEYVPQGVCSRLIRLTIEEGRIVQVQFVGGCHGNLQGISALVAGEPVDEVIAKLEGIRCGGKSTSCPHQLTLALRAARAEAQSDL